MGGGGGRVIDKDGRTWLLFVVEGCKNTSEMAVWLESATTPTAPCLATTKPRVGRGEWGMSHCAEKTKQAGPFRARERTMHATLLRVTGSGNRGSLRECRRSRCKLRNAVRLAERGKAN